MADAKLLAEWFWTDRWMGSSAFLLPMEARGLYREMLTQAWRRGARLPTDPEAIQRAVGATPAEWLRSWPLIAKYWRISGDYLINDTQQAVYAEAMALREQNHDRAVKGASARWKPSPSNAQASAQAMPGVLLKECPPSPSPSLSLSPENKPAPKARRELSADEYTARAEEIARRSKAFKETRRECQHEPRCPSTEWHRIELAKDAMREE